MISLSEILRQSRNYAPIQEKFTTKKGWLTPYALSCGYVQLWENGGFWVKLEKIESTQNAYRVVYRPSADDKIVYQVCQGIVETREVYLNLIMRNLS